MYTIVGNEVDVPPVEVCSYSRLYRAIFPSALQAQQEQQLKILRSPTMKGGIAVILCWMPPQHTQGVRGGIYMSRMPSCSFPLRC